jgi:hypothetical protein
MKMTTAAGFSIAPFELIVKAQLYSEEKTAALHEENRIHQMPSRQNGGNFVDKAIEMSYIVRHENKHSYHQT